jgi:Ca2+-binding RTX toxin-like protein
VSGSNYADTIVGDNSGDTLHGLAGNDTITGGTGDDFLFGDNGNDLINGGGGIDTAEYVGNRGDYTMFRNDDGSTSVICNNKNVGDGTDTLHNIAYLEFMDQTIALSSLAAPHGDFNGEGHSDVLWQNTSGQTAIWELDGTNLIAGGSALVGPNPGPSWKAIGTGDFNNAAERAMRPLALGRKNYLFAGSDEGGRRAAITYTLIESARLNDVDPEAWLGDIINRIADHPNTNIDELLPWKWRGAGSQAIAA